jgi:hypothetical protein
VHGYGVRFLRGTGYGKKDWRNVRAHRQAWIDAHGAIPPGVEIHHKCRNKGCVNVDHLEALSPSDHQGALGHGKLTRQQAEEIRQRRSDGERAVALAADYGVSRWTVYDILSRRIWK